MRLVEDGALSLTTRGAFGARRRSSADRRAASRSSTCSRTGRGSATTSTRSSTSTSRSTCSLSRPSGSPRQRRISQILEGHPQKFPPGERFAYSNSGYVVLALIAERVATTSVPRPRPRPRLRARRDGRHGLPSLGRAPRRARRSGTCRSTGSGGRTSSTSPYAAAAMAGSTRPPRTLRRSGARSSRARSSTRRRSRTCSESEALRARTAATGWASGFRSGDARYDSRAAIPEFASPPSTTRTAS